MTIRTALVLVVCTFATAAAGPKSTVPKSTLALTSTSIAGSGPDLVKKVKRANSSAKPIVFHECEGGWTVHYAVALAAPVPSAELTLKISDVTGMKEAIATRHKIIYSEAVVARGMLKLDRDEVTSANAKLLIEIESEGVAIAQQTFYIQGSTQTAAAVEFTAEEATASDDEVAAEDVRAKRK